MYTTDYFVRFINDTAHAASDLERGYSFYGHAFYASEESAADSDMVEYHGFSADDIVSFERHGETVYGFAVNGLSGFGPFETVEEAREYAAGGFLAYPHAAIYTGRENEADPDGLGVLFRPSALVEVL